MSQTLEIVFISIMISTSMITGILLGYQLKSQKVEFEKVELRRRYLEIKNKCK